MTVFDTQSPIRIRVELASGDVTVRLADTATTQVEVDGDSDDVIAQARVEMRGDELLVIGPRRTGFFRSTAQIDIDIEAPAGSSLDAQLRSADLRVMGTLSAATVQSGSGDVDLDEVAGELLAESGSGDVRVQRVDGTGRLRAGSGNLEVSTATDRLECHSASGDVSLGHLSGRSTVRTASGDVQVEDCAGDLGVTTASGDHTVQRARSGAVRLQSASGDVHVGVAAGTAAWLDVSTLSGSVSSELEGSDEPGADESRVALHVRTVSGDIHLART